MHGAHLLLPGKELKIQERLLEHNNINVSLYFTTGEGNIFAREFARSILK
jgi:hypothetical protein